MSWTKNASSNNVMVAWNTTNTFGTPTGSYVAGDPVSGGGTVIYNGSATTYNHTLLNSGTTYYYKAWSVNTTFYSSGVTANATTDYDVVIRYVTSSGAGSKTGTSWSNAYDNTQLQTAIDEEGVSDVWAAAGTYKPSLEQGGAGNRYKSFRLKNHVAVYGGFAGTETLLSERNIATNITILSGDMSSDDNYSTVPATNITDNCYHVIYNPDQATDINNTAILDGFSIIGGNADGESSFANGGGICNDYSSPSLSNLIISNNSAIYGGGLFIYYSSPLLTNVKMISNSAGSGGGVCSFSSSPSFTNVTITGNTSTSQGGGIANYYVGLSSLFNCIVWGNTAASAGNQIYLNADASTTLNFSCYSNSTGDISGSGTFTAVNNNITSHPKFVNATTGDYRLYGNSPCVNSGNNSCNSQSYDVRNATRIQNTTIDMGAYEWTSGTDPDYEVIKRYVTWEGAGSKNGTNWANAYDNTQLQTAIDETDVTDIWVAAGTYKPTLELDGTGDRYKSFRMKNNCAIYGGFAGTETQFSERNIASNPTILSGDLGVEGTTSDNSYHVIYNSVITSSAILDGFTLKNGQADGGSSPYNCGGGIYNFLSSPTIRNVIISNNVAYKGGGIYNDGYAPVFTNVRISDNYGASYGGGIFCEQSGAVFSNVSICNNSTSGLGGGALIHYSSPTFNNAIVWGNHAAEGAESVEGLQLFAYSSSVVTMNYSCFSNGSNDIHVESSTFTYTNNNTNSNPIFVDSGNKDYRLFSNSPCVNTGNNSYNSQSYDVRNQTRIQSSIIDMGAYEWTEGVDPYGVMTWLGGASGAETNWSTAANWDGNAVSNISSNILIPNVVYYPVVNQDPGTPALCNNLTINSGAILTIAEGKALTVNGTLTNAAGTTGIVIQADASGQGSLIHHSDGVSATVQRYIPANVVSYISPPVSDALRTVFAGSINNKLYQYNSNAANNGVAWELIPINDTPLEIMRGYVVKYAANTTLSFTGILLNGTQAAGSADHVILYNGATFGWNLIGNPFTSAINVGSTNSPVSGWTVGSNIQGFVSFRKSDNNLAYWSLAGAGTGNNGGTQYIPATQAYWINLEGTDNIAYSFDNQARTHVTQNIFKNGDSRNLIRINSLHNGHTDQTTLTFQPQASDNFDSFDAEKMFINDTNFVMVFTTLPNGRKFAINGFSELQDSMNIPLGFEFLTPGSVEIEVDLSEFDPALPVFLEDVQTGVWHNVRENPLYSLSSPAITSSSRLILHLNPVSVTGQLTYANNQQTPISNITLTLRNAGDVILETTVTDAEGNFRFTFYSTEPLHVVPELSLPTGGINAIDALAILKHFTGIQSLEGIFLSAADADGSGYVNAIDALLVQRRFVELITSFKPGDWIVESEPFILSQPGEHIIQNIRVLTRGDVNGSFIPSSN
ncbi:MAG: dockerin type I domain-containing protein [Bacteroidetes bacterium]|nr:dockerin type I domain-containing protein [Bacteroidota bacterium]